MKQLSGGKMDDITVLVAFVEEVSGFGRVSLGRGLRLAR